MIDTASNDGAPPCKCTAVLNAKEGVAAKEKGGLKLKLTKHHYPNPPASASRKVLAKKAVCTIN